jgi:hypothetical protein
MVAMAKRICVLVDENTQTQRIRFEPANEDAAQAMRANRWKSSGKAPGDHRRSVLLVRSIATKLREAMGFVAFHFDGDTTWRDRDSSGNAHEFRKGVIERVRKVLAEHSPESVENVSKLIAIVPFYSIEAWLYQNTAVALRLCREQYNGKDVELFEQWRADPTLLDDVERPKELTCLGSRHNLELTKGFPAAAVAQTGRSFASVVEAARSCAALVAALASTTT